jgi:uncharacterized repeat protein (TIGR03943 family)
MTKARDISASRLGRALVFLVFSFFINWLIESGKLSRIVHPRMHLWIAAAGVVFLVLAFAQTLSLAKKPVKDDSLTFFIPLVFVMVVAYLFVEGDAASPGRLQMGDESLATQGTAIAQRDASADKAATEPLPAWIRLDNDQYWTLYNRLYDHPDNVVGRRITVRGFIYRKKDFPPHTALVSRNLIWCCSADMAVIGFLVEDPAFDRIPDSGWVEATGKLATADVDVDGSGNTSRIPLVISESLKPVNRGSDSETIFPY